MIDPSYLTRMRSERVISSSRSSERTRMAVPFSRCSTSRLWMYRVAAREIVAIIAGCDELAAGR
jgi:hypothetical protein